MPLLASLKRLAAANGLLAPSSAVERERLADVVAQWMTEGEGAEALTPLLQIELLRRFTYEQGIAFGEERRVDVLEWLVALVGRVVRPEPIEERGWPPPVQFRVQSIYDGIDRIGDYVLLYEAAIHLHFVAVASQFIAMTHGSPREAQPAAVELADRVLVAALSDDNCMGGRVWLHRAGGISRAGHELVLSGVAAPLPELFEILEPEQLALHSSVGDRPGHDGVVRKGGPTFGLFSLLQQVRNAMQGHPDGVDQKVPAPVARGLLALAAVLCDRLSPYRRLRLAVTGLAGGQVVLDYAWSDDGKLRFPENTAFRQQFIRTWGAPPEEDGKFPAPVPPAFDGWSWEESLLLFDPAAPRTRYAYLMPLGCRYQHSDAADKVVPGLLDSVVWRREKASGRRLPSILQRKYMDRRELHETWHRDEREQAVARVSAARENLRALVEYLIAKYGLELEPAAEEQVVERVFDLKHGERAVRVAQETLSRDAEVERILARARASSGRGGQCGRLLLVGPSGIGKSVLMAQAYARVHRRALFFSMNDAPEPDREPAAPGSAGEAVALGDRQERHLGVPVRMHWLASAAGLLARPAPTSVLDAGEAQRRLAALLGDLARADATDPVFVFIDALDQASAPELLLQGLLPFSALPSRLVIVASTQEDASLLARIGHHGLHPWERLDVSAIDLEQTRALLLQSWKAPPPEPASDALVEFVHRRSAGFPLLIAYWGEQLEKLCREDPATAEHRLRAALSAGSVGALPPRYFDALAEIAREFVPRRLPEAVLWCLSLIERPVTRDRLTAAIGAMRSCLDGLPAVSKSDVDSALVRLARFVRGDALGVETTYRLAHPVVGTAWIDYRGTRELVLAIDEALLPFGAAPRVTLWSDAEYVQWLARVLDEAPLFDDLEVASRYAVVTSLLERLRAPGLESWSHRRGGLLALKAWYLHKLNRNEEALAASDEAMRWPRPDASSAPLVLAEWSWDHGNAVSVAGSLGWRIGGRRGELLEEFEDALRLKVEAYAAMGNATAGRRASLASSYGNRAILYQTLGRHDEALSDLEEGTRLLEAVDLTHARYRGSLGDLYAGKSFSHSTMGSYELALDADAHAIELRSSLDLSEPENRSDLATSHFNRGIDLGAVGRHEEALKDETRAIELRKSLDLSNPEHATDLAQSYQNRAATHAELKRYADAVDDLASAISLCYSSGGRGPSQLSPAERNRAAVLHLSRAYSLAEMERFAEAAEECGTLIAQRRAAGSPEHPAGDVAGLTPSERESLGHAHFNRAYYLTQLGRLDEALEDYSRSIAVRGSVQRRNEVLDCDLVASYGNRSDVYNQLRRHDAAIEDATAAIDLGATLDPSNERHRAAIAEAHGHRGKARAELDPRDARAMADYDRAVELNLTLTGDVAKERRSDAARVYRDRAALHEALGRPDLAAADRARADELAPARDSRAG